MRPRGCFWIEETDRCIKQFRLFIVALAPVIEYRYAEGNRERFPELAAELVRLKVDIIVAAGGDLLVRPVMNASKAISIVMMGGGADPVEAGPD